MIYNLQLQVACVFSLIFQWHWYYTLCNSMNSRYDKSINLFSPNGELLQVKYAEIAGDLGTTVIAIPTYENNEHGILLCSKSTNENDILMDKKLIRKVAKVDKNIWFVFSGYSGDGLALLRSAREYCLQYHMTFGNSPSISAIAKQLGQYQHRATLVGDERPLGVHAMLVGYDEYSDHPKIFSSRASGKVSQWKAYCIGKNSGKY